MNSCAAQMAPANEATAKREERLMYIGTALEAHAQAPKLMQPCVGAFHYPTRSTQATAMFGTSAGDQRRDAPLQQCGPMRVRVVSTVGLQRFGPALRMAYLSGDRRNAVNQRQQLSHIVIVGAGQNDIQRNALRVRDEMVLAARTTAIGWVRSSFFPAPTARIEELSTTAREKSKRSAPRNFASSTSCSRRHTPRRCQSLSRRQHVIPEPQPISFGSISQGIPDFKTNST